MVLIAPIWRQTTTPTSYDGNLISSYGNSEGLPVQLDHKLSGLADELEWGLSIVHLISVHTKSTEEKAKGMFLKRPENDFNKNS